MDISQKILNIRSSSRQLVRELNFLKGAFNDTGFSYSQCHMLFELDVHKVLNLAELSEILRLDKSTSSRIIKKLIDKGLVQVTKNENDQRQKLFSLTPLGKACTVDNNLKASAQVGGAIDLLDEAERNIVQTGLKLYAKSLYQSRVQKDFSIRLIEPQDNAQVANIVRKTLLEFDVAGSGSSIHDPEVDQMYETYQAKGAAYFVVAKSNEILGCAGIAPLKGEAATICELQKMYFLPVLRGMGLGKKLLTICLEKAKSLGYQKCYLETVERMWQANLLYQKMGFKQLDHQVGSTGHNACDTTYIKELT